MAAAFQAHALSLMQSVAISSKVSETITYAGVSILAVVDRDSAAADTYEEGRAVIEEAEITITDNSDVTYPGVAAPAIGDAVTIDGDGWKTVEVRPKDIDGSWNLRLRRVDRTKRGSRVNIVDR